MDKWVSGSLVVVAEACLVLYVRIQGYPVGNIDIIISCEPFFRFLQFFLSYIPSLSLP